MVSAEKTYERATFCHDWGDKECIAGRARLYRKAHIMSATRVGKIAGTIALYLRGITLKLSK